MGGEGGERQCVSVAWCVCMCVCSKRAIVSVRCGLILRCELRKKLGCRVFYKEGRVCGWVEVGI